MKVDQISVFLENKFGRLAEVTNVLASHQINLRAVSLADTADFGILRLIVNDPENTLAVLKENGFTVAKTEVLAIEVPDRPGGLAGILDDLSAQQINVEYLYAFVQKSGENAIIICRFDNSDAAAVALKTAGVHLLSKDDIDKI